MFSTLDQLSGLAYRTNFFDIPFHPDIFPCHVYPFASIFKKHPVVFLKDYSIAVRIATSQTRHLSSIYNKSPVLSWVQLFENVFPEKDFVDFKTGMIKNFIASNYVGLVQIRNYAKYRYLLREVGYLVKYRSQNLYNPTFWFFALGTALMPPQLLIPLVDWYKNKLYSKTLRGINFKYRLTNA